MDRKSTIMILKKIGCELAEQYGYTEISIGEDRVKGIWGEALTNTLEKKYGECTEEITWYANENSRKEERICFRYRFANPCLSIRKQGELFCEMEISDYDYDSKEYSGNFDVSAFTVWKRGGLELQKVLLDKWDKYTK